MDGGVGLRLELLTIDRHNRRPQEDFTTSSTQLHTPPGESEAEPHVVAQIVCISSSVLDCCMNQEPTQFNVVVFSLLCVCFLCPVDLVESAQVLF